jgi:hypothetical protein
MEGGRDGGTDRQTDGRTDGERERERERESRPMVLDCINVLTASRIKKIYKSVRCTVSHRKCQSTHPFIS